MRQGKMRYVQVFPHYSSSLPDIMPTAIPPLHHTPHTNVTSTCVRLGGRKGHAMERKYIILIYIKILECHAREDRSYLKLLP